MFPGRRSSFGRDVRHDAISDDVQKEELGLKENEELIEKIRRGLK